MRVLPLNNKFLTGQEHLNKASGAFLEGGRKEERGGCVFVLLLECRARGDEKRESPLAVTPSPPPSTPSPKPHVWLVFCTAVRLPIYFKIEQP